MDHHSDLWQDVPPTHIYGEASRVVDSQVKVCMGQLLFDCPRSAGVRVGRYSIAKGMAILLEHSFDLQFVPWRWGLYSSALKLKSHYPRP